MNTGVYWQIIYWLSTPALAALVVILLVRGLPRQLPLFFSYVLIACLSDIARFITYHESFSVYASTYWISEVIDSFFSFLATGELFLRRVFPQFQKVSLYRLLFPTAGAVIISVGVLTALHTIRIRALINILHGLDFLRVATLLFFLALMLFMGRQWGRYESGIALGFGVDATAFLGAFAIWAWPGFLRSVANNMPVFAFDIACLIWLITFLKPEKPIVTPSGPITPELLTEARKWQEAAKGSVTGKTDPE